MHRSSRTPGCGSTRQGKFPETLTNSCHHKPNRSTTPGVQQLIRTALLSDDMIRLIAAMDSRRGIATASGIPWKLPGDTAYFREQTSRGLILMGRSTYDEFAAPLHGRDNFVLSAGSGDVRAGFQKVGSLDQLRASHPGEDIWVIGGATV